MSTSLILDSLKIRNFRAFSDLCIEHFGRVNLIVGKNNVGKSSLLEALWLYSDGGSPKTIWKLLEGRNEGNGPTLDTVRITEEQIQALRYLFHGRQDIRKKREPIQIGPCQDPDRILSITIDWWHEYKRRENISQGLKSAQSEENDPDNNGFPSILTLMGNEVRTVHRLDRPALDFFRESTPLAHCIFVFADGFTDEEMAELWDKIALTDSEESVISSLRIITPEIERLTFVGNQLSNENWERMPVVKISGFNEPIPLRSLGEGMNRLFGIALALVNAKNGILLMDEIESGLHYSVQPDVWRLIFETAHRLNVQVFATTHSRDCIEAFQQAAEDNQQEEGILIRLEQRKGKIVATEFDERRLGIATREAIEVR